MESDQPDYRPPADNRPNRGFHDLLEQETPHLFIDGCMQIWPDARLEQAHLHGCSCYAVTALPVHGGAEEALQAIMGWHETVRQHDNLRLALTAGDILAARTSGQASLLLAAQDGEFLGAEPARVEAFQRLGLRMLIPAYNRDNLLCGGALDRTGAGLSVLGQAVIEECDRHGVVLDATHVSRQASLDMISSSANPVVFSHANPRALVDNPRNIDDEQIKAVAARGGVIGIVNWGPLLFRAGASERPTVHDFLDHIDYVAQLLGSTTAIGIGTDFSLGSYPPHEHDRLSSRYLPVAREMDRHVTVYQRAPERFAAGFSQYPEILDVYGLLQERGYSEADIAGIAGGNFLRVFGQVWGN